MSQAAAPGLSSQSRPALEPSGPGFFDIRSALLTPREGWTALAFLLAMDLVVVATVQQTDWVKPMPSLWAVALLSFIASMAAIRAPGPWPVRVAAHLLVIALGVAVALLETAGTLTGSPAEKVAEVVTRTASWTSAITGQGISNDRLPFLIILSAGAWLIVYLSVLFAFLLRWPWAAVIPPAVGLMTHQTYLPPATYAIPLFFFLLFAILFMGQTNLLRARKGIAYTKAKPRPLSAMVSLVMLTSIVFALSWVPPVKAVTWQPLRDSYIATRGPYANVENSMERMFAGVPAKKPGSPHSFGAALPLRGSSGSGETLVLTVITDYPGYWRGQTYDFYQGQGWLVRQETREVVPTDRSPVARRATTTYKKQAVVAQQIALQVESDVLFSGGQPAELSIASTSVELAAPRTFQISLVEPPSPGSLPPDLQNLAQRLVSSRATARQVRTLLPAGTEVIGEASDSVTVRRSAPAIPDVLAIKGNKRMKSGTTYDVLSLTSIAGVEDLRDDTAPYPKWVVDNYLQLPPSLPARVRALAQDITKGAANPYDKAEAIERYLRQLQQAPAIESPPLNVDAVDYFLFTKRQGHADYFASAMTVLLRAVDVPARLAAGYSSGDYDEEATMFLVREDDAHAWPEVFFPSYGWVAFEPLPTLPTIPRGSLALLSGDVEEAFVPEGGSDFPEDEIEEEPVMDDVLVPDNRSFFERFVGSAFRAVLYAALVVAAIGLTAGLAGALLWQVNFIGMNYPAGMYARMALLGTLAWRGPRQTETPVEYADALSGAMALRQGPALIANGFVRNRYGGREASTEDRIAVDRAWRSIRKSLLRRLASRLNVLEVFRRE